MSVSGHGHVYVYVYVFVYVECVWKDGERTVSRAKSGETLVFVSVCFVAAGVLLLCGH